MAETLPLTDADGVADLSGVLAACRLPVRVPAAGGRGWRLADVAADADGATVTAVRLAFRADERRLTVVTAAPGGDRDRWAAAVAAPLLFAALRHQVDGASASAVARAVDPAPRWTTTVGGWRVGDSGTDAAPVRLAARQDDDALLVIGASGVAPAEVAVTARSLEVLGSGSDRARALAVEHRRSLAQRWWDAPRRPWGPARRRAG